MLAPFRAPADQATRGSRFSSRSASGRLMMGSEGWGGNNLNRALAANQRPERGTLRTHPTRRPREDIFLPEQNSLSACRSSWPVQATEGTAALSLAPAEFAAIDPHPVQHYGQAPGDRDDGSTHPAPLSHPYAPRLQPRPFTAVGKQYLCGLVEHGAQQGIATFGHPAVIIGLARLVALRCQADMRADRPGMDEALRLVDRRTVG